MRQSITRRLGGGRTQSALPFWLILPTILVLLAIQVYPALYTGWLSLHKREPEGWTYVGLENFERLFKTSLFSESIGHTIVFLVGYTATTLIIGFFIALLLDRISKNTRLSGFYVTLLFIPWIIADLLVGLIFRLMVVPDYGLLSGFLQNPSIFPPDGLSILTAVPPQPWIGDFPFPPAAAMVYLIMASSWRALPFVTLLLLAAMQTVPNEIIESSRIDGASNLKIIRYIIIPLILPSMVVALFSLTLSGMNGVGMVFSLTGGGPGTSTHVLSYMLYSVGWDRLQFGRAAALALMIAVVNWLLISGTLRLTRVEEGHV